MCTLQSGLWHSLARTSQVQTWLVCFTTVRGVGVSNGEAAGKIAVRCGRAFKTAGKAALGSLPAATRWPLSEKQSALVHTLLHVAGDNNRMLPRLTQHAAAKIFARLGYNWCGVPRLGPHAMRTYLCWKAVNNASITVQDYPALACRMQVSLDTMTAVYVAPSLRAPAAQLAFRLHTADEQEQSIYVDQEKEQEQQKNKLKQVQRQRLQQEQLKRKEQQRQSRVQQDLQQTQQQQYMQQVQHMQQQQYMIQQQQYMCMMSAAGIPFVLPQPTAAAQPIPEPAPYGRAFSTLRHKYAAEIRSFMESEGLSVDGSTLAAASVAGVFKQLCLMRASKALPAKAKCRVRCYVV
jgi:hypothetical protein